MKADKQKALAMRDWVVGDAQDLLGLSRVEKTPIEYRMTLAERLKSRRKQISNRDLASIIEGR